MLPKDLKSTPAILSWVVFHLDHAFFFSRWWEKWDNSYHPGVCNCHAAERKQSEETY